MTTIIKLIAQVVKVQTTKDGGLRITLDLDGNQAARNQLLDLALKEGNVAVAISPMEEK